MANIGAENRHPFGINENSISSNGLSIPQPSNLSVAKSGGAKLTWENNLPDGNIFKDTKIVFIGDSNTAGNLPASLDYYWLNDICKPALESFCNANITNLAVNGYSSYKWMAGTVGDTTANSQNPDPAKNVTAALALNPDIVFLYITSNDAEYDFNVNNVMSNIQSIRDEVEKSGAIFMLAGVAPRNLIQTEKDKLNEIHQRLMEDHLDIYIPSYSHLVTSTTTIDSQYNADNIHFNEAGQKLIAEIFTEAIRNVIWQSTTVRYYEIWQSDNYIEGYTFVKKILANRSEYTVTSHNSGIKYYKIRPVGVFGNKGEYSDVVCLDAGVISLLETIQLNFDGGTDGNPITWERVALLPQNGQSQSNLTNIQGGDSGITITFIDDAGATSDWLGVAAWGGQTTNDSGIYPDDVLYYTFGTNGAANGVFELTGLHDANTYEFDYFASVTGGNDSNQQAQLRVEGATTNTSSTLSASDNTSNIVTVSNNTPVGGKLTLTLINVNSQSLINALVIRRYS